MVLVYRVTAAAIPPSPDVTGDYQFWHTDSGRNIYRLTKHHVTYYVFPSLHGGIPLGVAIGTDSYGAYTPQFFTWTSWDSGDPPYTSMSGDYGWTGNVLGQMVDAPVVPPTPGPRLWFPWCCSSCCDQCQRGTMLSTFRLSFQFPELWGGPYILPYTYKCIWQIQLEPNLYWYVQVGLYIAPDLYMVVVGKSTRPGYDPSYERQWQQFYNGKPNCNFDNEVIPWGNFPFDGDAYLTAL